MSEDWSIQLPSPRVRSIAKSETGIYLRENLGESLVDVIDVEALEQDLIAYLQSDEGYEGTG